MDLDLVLVHKNAKRELSQYPAILTLCLVNDIYIYTKIIVWCEDEKRSIPLQVERKLIVNTQGKDQLLLLRVSRRLAIFRQLTYQIYYKRI